MRLAGQLPPEHISNRRPRVIGAILIAVGLFVARWQIYDPLHAAEQHKEKVWVLAYLVGFAIIGPAWGLLLLLFGKRPNEWFKFDPQNLSLKSAASLIAFAAIGVIAIFYVIHSLEIQGYRVRTGL
jgi:hypothetical protein